MRLDLKLRFRPASALYSPVTRREILLYCLFAALLFGEKVVLYGGPFLGNDSYQYLSVANNLIAGNGPQTSIIYFDTERSWHRVPASLTTFPPGYPAAIAFLNLAGIDPAAAGFLVSALAGILLIPLVYWGAWLLNYNGLVTRLLLLGLIANAWYSFYSVFVLTESLFALVSTAAVLVLVTGLSRKQNDRKQLAWIITAHLLIGLAYWIRYAGLFLFGAVCLHFLLLAWRQREGMAWRGLAGLCVSGGIIAIGMVRNFLYVGTWRGGNDKVVAHPWFDVLENFLLQFHHLFMGGIAQPRLWLVDVLFTAGCLSAGRLGLAYDPAPLSLGTVKPPSACQEPLDDLWPCVWYRDPLLGQDQRYRCNHAHVLSPHAMLVVDGRRPAPSTPHAVPPDINIDPRVHVGNFVLSQQRLSLPCPRGTCASSSDC